MPLALPEAVPAPLTAEVIEASIETVGTLLSRSATTAAVVEPLAPQGGDGVPAMIETVVCIAVVPRLVARHRVAKLAAHPAWSDQRVSGLADSLLTGDTDAAMALVRPRPGSLGPYNPLPSGPFEAAARHLGDRWTQDACSEFDVTLALYSLQMVVRRLEQDGPAAMLPDARAGTALVAPHPGEPHGLHAALSAQALRCAGWGVRCAAPASDAKLGTLLAKTWFDVLDLSFSAAFRREDQLDAMKRTIASARRASRNPAVTITVAGRIFTEQAGLAASTGADVPDNASRARGACARKVYNA